MSRTFIYIYIKTNIIIIIMTIKNKIKNYVRERVISLAPTDVRGVA